MGLQAGSDFIRPGSLIAVDRGHLDVHEDEVEAVGFGLGDTALAIFGLDDRVPCAREKVAEHTPRVFLIFNDKDALGHTAVFRNSARIGSSIWKVEPLPSVDSTQMRPPCISTICLAMASPRPVPPLALVSELSTWWN
jgi:hypothetical protein